MDNYDDIINLPHMEPTRHPRMAMADRAAQFAPFAALSGHSDALLETARYTESCPELDENEREMLDRRLSLIRAALADGELPVVTVTWFKPDERKAGGTIRHTTAPVMGIDKVKRLVILSGGADIALSSIIDLQADFFDME